MSTKESPTEPPAGRTDAEPNARKGRLTRRLQIGAGLVVLAIIAATVLVLKPFDDSAGNRNASTPRFEPLIPDGPATMDDLCSGACTADLVALPELRAVESVLDLPMPETTGALSVERVWTGTLRGIFGQGWLSIWDIRLVDDTLSGPLPTEPLEWTDSGGVELTDGTTIDFDGGGRPSKICPDAATCTTAKWSVDKLELASGDATIQLDLVDGRAVRATAGDGRIVHYSYDQTQLTRVRSDAAEIDYSYTDGRLGRISGSDARTYEYDGSVLQSMTDRDGAEWTFTRSTGGSVDVGRPDGEIVTYEFSAGTLTKATGSKTGLWMERTYENGELVSEIRPRDGLSMERLSADTIQIEQSRELEPPQRSRYTYDTSGRLVRTESAAGTTTITYDGRSSRPLTTRVGDALTTLVYDDNGLLLGSKDPDGYEITVERDDLGQVRSLTDGTIQTSFTYDAAGNPTKEVSGSYTTTATYTADDKLKTLGLSDGTKLPFTYDASGDLSKVGSDDVDTTVSAIDAALETKPAIGDSVEEVLEFSNGPQYRYGSGRIAQYDTWGRLTRLTVDGRDLTRSYDPQGRLVRLGLPDGRRFTVAYTPAGRIATVADGSVTAEFDWNGDLLTSIETSDGTTYRYEYDATGALTSSQLGNAKWTYVYDNAGYLSGVDTPSGPLDFAWDAKGRPIRTHIDGQIANYTWVGDGLDLEAVTGNDGDVVRFTRNSAGQVTGMTTDDGEATFEYADGRLSHYELATGLEATLTYNANGNVNSVTQGGTTEQWRWADGQVTSVMVGDDRYDLTWFAPGMLASVVTDGDKIMDTMTDRFGRPTAIFDDGQQIADFTWAAAGLTSASIGGQALQVGYDAEFRPTKVDTDEFELTLGYRKGVATSFSADDATVTSTYEDGRLVTSRLASDDDTVNVEWDTQGRPVAFTGSEGNGTFTYSSNRVTSIRYDDKTRTVTYDDDGPSAADAGGAFLEDLFSTDGRFSLTSGEHLLGPWAPWFEALPSELGVDLPEVTSPNDVVSAAIANATPGVVSPIAPDDDIADRTAMVILATAAPTSLPVAADRLGTIPVEDATVDVDALFVASPTALIGSSVLDNLADGPGVFGKALELGSSIVSMVGRGGAAALHFLTGSTIGQVILNVLTIAGTTVLSAACIASGCPAIGAVAIGIVGMLAPQLAINGGDLSSALSSTFIEPVTSMWKGLQNGDAGAILLTAVVSTVSGSAILLFKAPSMSKSLAANSPRLAKVQRNVMKPLCGMKPIVCISVEKYGAAGQHVADAQATGAERLLKLDRAGAAGRRYAALKDRPSIPGMDYDEYPPAVSSSRRGLSIRPVDPSSNRSLGAYLGHQLRGLDDGSRFFVLPTA